MAKPDASAHGLSEKERTDLICEMIDLYSEQVGIPLWLGLLEVSKQVAKDKSARVSLVKGVRQQAASLPPLNAGKQMLLALAHVVESPKPGKSYSKKQMRAMLRLVPGETVPVGEP